ncbi:outer membrane protein assembly factor BamE [Methylomonas rivi]|uniref:Outer membrane protein assembly factor BamE n=1 Tax=Methylomonas rivi TaxID=2952226 RepID=A0ABT1U3H6_9GAMM|nr:outer membrane protein assembly factor BamE [Methylomonas sp. WSC-6]MCQ8128103.1 outer membrane protein assembly factor BamE [Methylomonas sp. WSC-6]
MKRTVFPLAVAASLTLLTACETILTNLPGVYSIDIEQGNMIDQAMVDQLRPNMSKRQVLYIMGSPMLTDTFHERRWDYLYSEQPGGDARVQKRISLYFDGDNLVGVQGDFRPSQLPVVKESTETTVDVPKRNLDRTMWEKITGLFGGEDAGNIPAKPENKPSELLTE